MNGYERFWLGPIDYHEHGGLWWASARHLAVSATTKAQARAKLYRTFNRRYRDAAESTFERLPVEGSDRKDE
jgi:hypothetical protein